MFYCFSFFFFYLNNLICPWNHKNNTDKTEKITNLKQQIANFVTEQPPVIDDAELKQRKQVLQTEVNVLIIKLTAKEQIEKVNTRIAELEKQERELGQEIADLERTEFTIDKFVKCKMDLIEARVNQLLKA